MRIGLLADTHIPDAAQELPPEVIEAFRDVDLILHAGDVFTTSVLDTLESIAPVLAACGDDDFGATLDDHRVKPEHVLELQGLRLLLIHDRPQSYISPPQRRRHSKEHNTNDTYNIVVFGHDHRPIVEYHGDVLLVNPGSPTFLNYRCGLGTVAILDIDSGKAQVHIRHL